MADETTNTNSTELGFAEAMNYLADRVASEEERFEYDVPDHAPALVVDEATGLLQTTTSIEMANEMADDEEDEVDEEAMQDAVLEDVVNLLTALAALKHERDLDIATAVEDRIDFIEDYKEFEEAMEEAEDSDEEMEVMDDLMTDEIAEELGVPTEDTGVDIGESVDDEDYDHDDIGKGFQ